MNTEKLNTKIDYIQTELAGIKDRLINTDLAMKVLLVESSLEQLQTAITRQVKTEEKS